MTNDSQHWLGPGIVRHQNFIKAGSVQALCDVVHKLLTSLMSGKPENIFTLQTVPASRALPRPASFNRCTSSIKTSAMEPTNWAPPLALCLRVVASNFSGVVQMMSAVSRVEGSASASPAVYECSIGL